MLRGITSAVLLILLEFTNQSAAEAQLNGPQASNSHHGDSGGLNGYRDQNRYPPDSLNVYPNDQNRYPNDPNRYPSEQNRYPNDPNKYPSELSRYSNDPNRYLNDQNRYPNDQNRYSNDQNRYPNDQNRYPNDQNRYPNDQNRYPNDQNRYPNDQNRYPNDQNRYPNDQNRYSSDPNRYPNDQNRYSSDGRGYSGDRDGYRDGEVGYREDIKIPVNPRISDHVARISGPELRALLDRVDVMLSHQCTKNVATQWQFETNVSPATQQAALIAQLEYADYQRAVWEILNNITREQVQEGPVWRQIQFLSVIGPAALPPELLDRYNKLIYDMLAVYNGATTCGYNEPFKCGLRLEPELTVVMGRSRDWDELQHSWLEWRRLTGQKVRDLFEQIVELSNKAAQLNHFKNAAEYWMFPYESPAFRYDLDEVWEEVKPLYELLHAYVRRKLRDLYGPEKLSRKAPLPAHILGDMWGQSWSNVLDVTIPYPGKNFLDVTEEMVNQGYTPLTMFQLAEEFYLSLNMSILPPEFWAGSIIEELPDRAVICQPSAWDFCNRRDYRIKMCTQVNMKDFVTVHHEVGHLQYFLHYKHLPKVFRDGANPGFHEAVGEAVALSIATPQHLQDLGLVQGSVDDTPHNINALFSLALDKLPLLAFSLSLDQWRWDIFEGAISSDQYNCHWWRLREKYGGIKPPVLRSEIDFDPGSKYHVAANMPYIRFFVGTVLQFQLHSALCKAAGQYDPDQPLSKPLFKCDIYRNKEAGRLLKDMMKLGSSVPWTEALYAATGETRLYGSHIREYFRPLEDWLRNENLRTNEFVGWTYDGDYCKQSIETAGLQVRGGYYNTAAPNADCSAVSMLIVLCAMFRQFVL